MIPETSALSDLIGTLYDTALDRALWPDVLKNLAEFVGGSGASIYSKNSDAGAVYHQFGIDPHYEQLYFSKYVRLDPTTPAQCLTKVGQLVSTVDFIPYCEFVETPFYREWGRPQGLADFLTTPLDKSADSVALFGVFRSEEHGLVDDEMRRRAALLTPLFDSGRGAVSRRCCRGSRLPRTRARCDSMIVTGAQRARRSVSRHRISTWRHPCG